MSQKVKRARSGRITSSTMCSIHPEIPALTHCKRCGRAMCKGCASMTQYPHVCSFCYPQTRVSIHERRKKVFFRTLGGVTLGAVALWVVLLLLLPIGDIREDFRDADRKDALPPDPEPSVYLDSGLIYPVLMEGTYASGEKIDISFKIYVTNNYREPVPDVRLDLLILKNEVIWAQDHLLSITLEPNSTTIVKFEDVPMPLGDHVAEFVLWQRGKVTQKSRLDFSVSKDDVSIPPPPPDNSGNWGSSNGTSDEANSGSGDNGLPRMDVTDAGALSGHSSACCFLVLLVLLIVIVAIVIVFVGRTGSEPAQAQREQQELLRKLELAPGKKR